MISGYSKSLSDKSLITHLAKAIEPYEKFKKMYKVDSEGNIGKFRGKQELLNNMEALDYKGIRL